MSQEVMVAPVSSVDSGQAADGLAHQQNQLMSRDAAQLDALIHVAPMPLSGGGLIQAVPAGVGTQAANMGIPDLASHFSDGLKHGFVTRHLEHFVNQSALASQPGSGITSGQLMAEALKLSLKLGVSDAFRSVSSKLSDGINNIVVKQG